MYIGLINNIKVLVYANLKALNEHADWVPQLQISFAIHLRAIHGEFAPENVVVFVLYYITVFIYVYLPGSTCIIILKQLFTSVSVASGGYLPCRFWAW